MTEQLDDHDGIETDAQFIEDWTRWVEEQETLRPPEPKRVKIMARAYATYEDHQRALTEYLNDLSNPGHWIIGDVKVVRGKDEE